MFLKENTFLSSNQSGFTPIETCINQPISITQIFFKDFDAAPTRSFAI